MKGLIGHLVTDVAGELPTRLTTVLWFYTGVVRITRLFLKGLIFGESFGDINSTGPMVINGSQV